ncbi:MAG: serine/threonine-protein kinase [Acidobacteriia bacterium]|nr:serine/threonine-protein kinase [Terriglobia bacterium]
MPISAGEKLGPYEILTPLGEGGMGQVWTARDTRLNRIVAIKTSHQRFSERFEREVQAIAALNHPNICSLYDVGPDYLVMERVEGKPLKGPVPLDQALQYASQICDALDAAHRAGIIHRDLKPGNILLGKNGVKVLDFGLAKIEHASASQGTQTVTMPLTNEGAILGTLQYMSPEQLEGKEADARSDIFSFGVVLYEMITGKRPFTGGSQASLIAAVLKEQARPVQELQPLTPAGLDRVLQTCLEKDPEKRWQSAREVKHALEWMVQGVTPAPLPSAPPTAAPAKQLRMWQGIAAVMTAIALGFAGWMFWPKAAPPAQMTRFQVPLPENVTFGQYVSLSPDGRKLVFNATGEQAGLWVRDLDALEWRKLPGTQGAVSPFWSPDSRFVGFGFQNQLKKIDISGGPAQTLCESSSGGVGSGAWNRDGVIVFGGRGAGPMWKVSQAGGIATEVTSVDTSRGEGFHALPTFMPDGKHFIYLRSGSADVLGMYGGSLDAKPSEQSRERILAGQFAASYVNGYLFFMRENTLMAQPFAADQMKLTGEPVPVAEHVGTTQAIGVFSVSPSGALAYRSGAQTGSYQLTWFDRQGKILSTFGQPSPDEGIVLSPDGTRGAVRDASTGATGDLWTLDFARGVRTRFTFRQNQGSYAVWSPDGNRIAFAAGASRDTLYEKASSGAGDEKELLKEPGKIHVPTSWSRDGRFLLYYINNAPKTGVDQWMLPMEGDHKPVLLLGTEFNESQGSFSPDMRWIAYTSNESGRSEVYVRPFTTSGPSGTPSLGEGKWQVSKDGGDYPAWRADGKEIIFQAPPNGTVKMAVDVRTKGAAFEAGVPQRLFQAPLDYGWDVTADGKRFLLAVPEIQQAAQVPITVVLNWQAQLKK